MQVFERFDENYRAQSQQDIDNFVRYVGSALTHPPYFSPQLPGPHSGLPGHAVSMPQSGSQQTPSDTAMQPILSTPQHQSFGHPTQQLQQQLQQQLPWQQQHQQPQQQSNVVPFQRKSKANTRPGTPEGGPGSIPGRFLDDGATVEDKRPILLFDLNGTLTSHTAARHSSGKTLIRPGIQHLRRVQVSKSLVADTKTF